jgi:hypothetical protein
MSRATRIPLWAEGNSGTSELDLQQSLACSDAALSLLAQELNAPTLVMREIGGSGGIDVAAFFGDSGSLLLVDCKNSKPATPARLREQRTQANRLVASTLANIRPLPSIVRLVLLAGWSEFEEDTTAGHLSGWRNAPGDWSRVPFGQRWSVLPFAVQGDSEVWCAIGRWEALMSCEWAPALARAEGAYRRHGRLHTFAGGLVLREDSTSAFTLRIPAGDYLKATGTGSDTGIVRNLLDSAYAGRLDSEDVAFLGETNEKGNVRLCFIGSSAAAWDSAVAAIESGLSGSG